MSKQSVLALLLGVAVAVNAFLAGMLVGTPTATGDTSAASGWVMTTGVLQGKGQGEALYLYDTQNKKLAIYFANNTRLELIAVRDLQWDFVVQNFSPRSGSQDPTVDEMKEVLKKGG